MKVVKQLWDIQELETAQFELERLMKNNELVGRLRQVKKDIQDEQAKFDCLQAEYNFLKNEIKQLEDRLRTQDQELAALNNKLYGGQMNSIKEIAGVQTQIDKIKQKISVHEEQGLCLLEKQNKLKYSLNQAAENLQKLKALFHTVREEYSRQQRQLKGELSKLCSSKENKYQQVRKDALELYLALKKEKKKPVAKVVNGVCGGCRLVLTYDKLRELKAKEFVQCDHCGRLIFME